ncbi:MAG: glycoside hydrolase family 13 protein [Oscillospiraceae bacterium]|nr:glycoside hydrolase family 13 protein [Oscillospiraceae bacterium]
MHIHIPVDCGATRVALMLEDQDARPSSAVPFVRERTEGPYEIWAGEFTLEVGLYYYWFRITKDYGGFGLYKAGRDTNMEAGDKWQISCIPADFTVPDYARGTVMYQIMPDRFFKYGECDLTDKLRPFSIHKDTTETPNYFPDAEGNWNSDFFGGNLAGIREKLPYLKDLGVKILYLNPIFMAYSNHRYDTADYKRIDPMLGTEADFRALCDAAHRQGMYVVLDGVFSHTGSNSVYFDANGVFGHGAVSDPDSPYRNWYRFHHFPDSYEAWWGIKTLPCTEELAESYVNYIIEDEDSVVAHWMGLGADGFRLDVADELPDAFIRKLKERIRGIRPDALLIGEVWEDASNKRAYGISRRYFVDAELDSTMNYPWRTAILNYVRGQDDGTAMGEAIMSLAENYPPQVLSCVMNLLSTHDTPRILTLLGDRFEGPKSERANRRLSREDRLGAVDQLRLASFLQFMLPGMASIFYGDEAGLEGFEDPFCRRCFPWEQIDMDLHDYFRQLARTKNSLDTLRFGDIRVLEAGQGRLCFMRRWEGQTSWIYVNQGDSTWNLPPRGDFLFGRGFCYDGEHSAIQKGGFCLMHERSDP